MLFPTLFRKVLLGGVVARAWLKVSQEVPSADLSVEVLKQIARTLGCGLYRGGGFAPCRDNVKRH